MQKSSSTFLHLAWVSSEYIFPSKKRWKKKKKLKAGEEAWKLKGRVIFCFEAGETRSEKDEGARVSVEKKEKKNCEEKSLTQSQTRKSAKNVGTKSKRHPCEYEKESARSAQGYIYLSIRHSSTRASFATPHVWPGPLKGFSRPPLAPLRAPPRVWAYAKRSFLPLFWSWAVSRGARAVTRDPGAKVAKRKTAARSSAWSSFLLRNHFVFFSTFFSFFFF